MCALIFTFPLYFSIFSGDTPHNGDAGKTLFTNPLPLRAATRILPRISVDEARSFFFLLFCSSPQGAPHNRFPHSLPAASKLTITTNKTKGCDINTQYEQRRDDSGFWTRCRGATRRQEHLLLVRCRCTTHKYGASSVRALSQPGRDTPLALQPPLLSSPDRNVSRMIS